jgi:hypothetical protein
VSSQWPLDVKYDRKGSFELDWPLDVKYDSIIINVIYDIVSNNLMILCHVVPWMQNMIGLWVDDSKMQNMIKSMWLIYWKIILCLLNYP